MRLRRVQVASRAGEKSASVKTAIQRAVRIARSFVTTPSLSHAYAPIGSYALGMTVRLNFFRKSAKHCSQIQW
jgi:hypothetical protein